MKSVSTFNALHLGDNLVHLHFLRAMAKAYPEIAFIHGAPDQHLAQLYPLWQDLPNLTVTSIGITPPGALNAWCGADGWWYQQGDTADWLTVYTRWLDVLAERMGLVNPIKTRTDFLFDYPALHRDEDRGQMTDQTSPSADILVINSAPMSGQASGYDPGVFDRLIYSLRAAGHIVAHTAPSSSGNFCTLERKMDVTAIGRLSQTVKAIVGVSTGPKWTTFNIWNQDTVKLRLILCNHERVEMLPTVVSANSLTLFPEILREHGLL
jgi:hypothetical protein